MTIYNYLYKHTIAAFTLLLISGLAFGAMTLNFFRLVAANWTFITRHGLMALKDGALAQALELIIIGILSMMIYLVFKFCERIIIDRMSSISLPGKSTDNN